MLSSGQKQYTHFYIHRLVANHFISNPQKKKEVNHKDGNKLNNHISNLEWSCRSEQINHRNHYVQQQKSGNKGL
jgi:hypothetical protein